HVIIAVGQYDGPHHLLRVFLEKAPVADEFKVAELFLAPEVLVLGLALAIVMQDPIARLPMLGMARILFPARQIQAGVEAFEATIHIGNLLRLRIGAGQFLDLEVLEPALRPFGFQGQIASARLALAEAGDFLAVDMQLQDAVVAFDAVMVPLAAAFGPIFARQTALPAFRMRPIRLRARAPDAEKIAL